MSTVQAFLVAALLLFVVTLMVTAQPDGQPFHQPGQSDRTVIYGGP